MQSNAISARHRAGRILRAIQPCLAIAIALAAVDAIAGSRHPAPLSAELAGNRLAEQPASITTTCFWGVPTGPLDGRNVLGIETHVAYWYSRIELPAGAKIILRGRFAHARFMSLTSYGTVAGQRGTALGGLSDFEIEADPGSVNPFRPGASRTAQNRSYTVTLSSEVDPGEGKRAPNTFYVGRTGETAETQTIELVLRVYRADRDRDLSGGTGLPEPTLVLADGTAKSGLEACAAARLRSGADAISIEGIGIPAASYLSLLTLSRPGTPPLPALPTHPAVNPARFTRFFNTQYQLASFYRGTVLEPRIATLPTDLRPGLYPTPANAYVSTHADRGLGPDPSGHNIFVLQGMGPTHPRSFDGDATNESAGRQVRYWSICNYGSAIAYPYLAPANTHCLFDEQIPIADDGRYTIVVSLPEDRPSNAASECGVAWMDWTTRGDGVPGGHDRLINLTIRQLLAAASFAHAFDKIMVPGTEKQVAGDYLPVGSYTTRALFERRGCSGNQSVDGQVVSRE